MKEHGITIKHRGISMNLKFSWHMFQFQVNTKTARDFQSGATPFSFENIRRLEAVQPSKAVKIVQIVSLSWDKLSTKPHFHSDHHNKLSIGRGCQSLKGKNHLWGWEGILWPASTLQCIVQRYYPDRFFLSISHFSSQKYRLNLSALETHKGRQFTNYNGVSATAILFEQRHWCAAWLSQGDKCGFHLIQFARKTWKRAHNVHFNCIANMASWRRVGAVVGARAVNLSDLRWWRRRHTGCGQCPVDTTGTTGGHRDQNRMLLWPLVSHHRLLSFTS